jgi:hypothetical protein
MTSRAIVGSATPLDLNSGHLTNVDNVQEAKADNMPIGIVAEKSRNNEGGSEAIDSSFVSTETI